MHILSFNKHPFNRIIILAIISFQSNINDQHFCLFRARLTQFSHGTVLLMITAAGTLTWFALQVWLKGLRGYMSWAPRLSLTSNMSGVNWPIYAHHGPTMLAQANLAAVPVHHHPHQSWCFGHCSSIITHTSFGVSAVITTSSPTPVWVCRSVPVSPPTPVLGCLQLPWVITHTNRGGSTMVHVSSPTPVLVYLQLPCVITHANLSESAPVEYLQHHPVLALWRPPDLASIISDLPTNG